MAILEEAVGQRPNDDRIRSSLGICYAALDRKEEAIREAKRGVELAAVSADTFSGTWRRADLAAVYAAVGEHDRAIEEIDLLLSIPALITPAILRIDPQWRPLLGHPRFEAVLGKYEGRS